METTNISVSRFLKTKFEKQHAINKSYSLRAFAQKIGLSPGGLTQILSGKKKLSMERAHLIATSLKLKGEEKKIFLLSVEFEQSKSSERKSDVFEKIQSLKSEIAANFFDLSTEQFRLITDWYGLATLECVSSYGSAFGDKELARHFGITLTAASLVLERLQRLELIEKNEKNEWKRIQDRVLITSALPSDVIRKHYLSVAEQSQLSYGGQTPQEKVSGTEVFAFDASQIEELRKLTDDYLNKLQKLAASGKNKKDTYQAIVNVFRLNKKTGAVQ